MKKITLSAFFVVTTVSLGITMLINLSVNSHTPGETAKTMIAALSHQNQTDLTQTFCDPHLAALVIPPTTHHPMFSALTYQESSQNNGTVIITVKGNMQSDHEVAAEAFSWNVYMDKRGGKWCIFRIQSTDL